MNVRGAWKFHVAHRSLVPIISLLVLLIVSLIWNVRQYRLIEYDRQRTLATERQKAEQEAMDAAHTRARREKRAEEAVANQRMEQLYRELDNLSQMSDRLLSQPVQQPKASSTSNSLKAADGSP
jgi:hypothetical protein